MPRLSFVSILLDNTYLLSSIYLLLVHMFTSNYCIILILPGAEPSVHDDHWLLEVQDYSTRLHYIGRTLMTSLWQHLQLMVDDVGKREDSSYQ